MNILVNYSGHMDWRCGIYSLFEKRLGWKVYSPNGSKHWAKFGITQPGHGGKFFGKARWEDGVKHLSILRDNYDVKLIPLEKFHEMKFDIIVVGNGRNEIPFFSFMRQFSPKSIFIRQIANLMETPHRCTNVLLSTKTPMPDKVSWVKHLMEPPPCFKYVPYTGKKRIRSFSNYFSKNRKDVVLWQQSKKILPGFEFKMHGAEGYDGWVVQDELHEAMQDTMFIWHVKASGGGGFTCQEALASGRPLIVKKNYCRTHKTRAEDYLVDGVNCVDISFRPLVKSLAIIRKWSQPNVYEKRCKEVLRHYNQFFNFDREAKLIKAWIETLRPGV